MQGGKVPGAGAALVIYSRPTCRAGAAGPSWCRAWGCEGLRQRRPGSAGLRLPGLQWPAACSVPGRRNPALAGCGCAGRGLCSLPASSAAPSLTHPPAPQLSQGRKEDPSPGQCSSRRPTRQPSLPRGQPASWPPSPLHPGLGCGFGCWSSHVTASPRSA